MKITATMDVSRCELGNVTASLSLEVDTSSTYGNPPLMGSIDHVFDQGRKTIVAAIAAAGQHAPAPVAPDAS